MTSIKVEKNTEGESNESLIRRFTRKVQSSRKLILAKQKQYRQPILSKRLRRRSAIEREKMRLARELERKLGKKVEDTAERSKFKRN